MFNDPPFYGNALAIQSYIRTALKPEVGTAYYREPGERDKVCVILH
jgi:hypothetical protein